jgi:hypothetical protein
MAQQKQVLRRFIAGPSRSEQICRVQAERCRGAGVQRIGTLMSRMHWQGGDGRWQSGDALTPCHMRSKS